MFVLQMPVRPATQRASAEALCKYIHGKERNMSDITQEEKDKLRAQLGVVNQDITNFQAGIEHNATSTALLTRCLNLATAERDRLFALVQGSTDE